jgi:hypothetical protein
VTERKDDRDDEGRWLYCHHVGSVSVPCSYHHYLDLPLLSLSLRHWNRRQLQAPPLFTTVSITTYRFIANLDSKNNGDSRQQVSVAPASKILVSENHSSQTFEIDPLNLLFIIGLCDLKEGLATQSLRYLNMWAADFLRTYAVMQINAERHEICTIAKSGF